MKLSEVHDHLLAAGATEGSFLVGSDRGDDVLVLVAEGDTFLVGQAERGRLARVLATHTSEEEACDDFVDRVLALPHLHLMGMHRSESAARALAERLAAAGLQVYTDTIPYGGPCDPRHRVFVVGADVHRARALLAADPERP